MSGHAALENLTILDLTRVLAGPFCTMMLADMGANVIKIEIPNGGDDTRAYPPFRINKERDQESIYFANINQNRKKELEFMADMLNLEMYQTKKKPKESKMAKNLLFVFDQKEILIKNLFLKI